MFDLLGVFEFAEDNSVSINNADFLFDQFQGDLSCVRSIIQSKKLQAVYRKHKFSKQSYFDDDGLHLFVVGEAFARSDSNINCSGPLTAKTVMSLYIKNQYTFLNDLKGNFTIVLIDEKRNQCSLYNSRFGISPFYYVLVKNSFLFSTSIAALIRYLPHEPEIDSAAVAELVLFNYPLGDRTYFRKIRMLQPAEIVRSNKTGLQRETWWDVRSLYNVSLYSRQEALERGSELFHKTVNDLSCDVSKVRVSFTSGFDSRALFAVLEKEPEDYLTYSFGIPGSLNIEIPELMSGELGINYQPVVLDGKYEEVFDKNALRAIMLSDCLSTVERANYPYAFEKLTEFSPVVITGLFGSELLRTFQNVGHIVSANLVRLNLAADPLVELQRILKEPDTTFYFADDMLSGVANEIESDISASLIERFGKMSPDRRFYMFLLTEGLRKYFGAEVHMERPWGINRFPYLDDEFVEFIFRAPFAGVYSRTLKPTVGNRFSSQYFYAYVINKYRPKLLKAPTDHGYPPADVLSPLALLKIGPKFLYWRWKRKRMAYREFKTEEWTEKLYQEYLFQKLVCADLFSQKLEDDFKSGQWRTNRLEFAKAASLKLYFDLLGIDSG